MNFYKHYLGDYDRKTAHLSLAEHGAYRILLDHYYSTLTPLPAELPTLCRICRATTESETESVSAVVNEFFPLNGDGRRHNSRADQELTRWKQQAEKNREIGKLGGRPRAHTETESVTEPITEQKPSPEVRSQKLEVRSQNPEKTQTKKDRKETETVALPDWIPFDNWQTYLAMRTRIRKPATTRAQRMLLHKLGTLKDAGYNPAQLLAESELKCWLTVYEPRQ